MSTNFKGITEKVHIYLTERPWVVVVSALVLGFGIRALFLGHVSHDYVQFLRPWYEIFVSKGGFPGLAYSFADYPPSYLTYLAGIAHYSLPSLLFIKLFSILFDVLLGACAGYLVWKITQNRLRATLAGSIVFLAPTVLLNSAAWGQADGIYAAFAIGALAALAVRRPTLAVALFVASLSFKLQAIFIAPIFLAFMLRGEIRLRHLWPAPLVYALLILPALIAGRSIVSILAIYPFQALEYPRLTYFTPNIYQLSPIVTSSLLGGLGIVAAAIIVVTLAVSLRRAEKISIPLLLTASLFASIALPFFLPHMHERYFYLAEALSICYALIRPGRWHIPVLLTTSALANYLFLLFVQFPTPPLVLIGSTFLVVMALGTVAADLAGILNSGRRRPEVAAALAPAIAP